MQHETFCTYEQSQALMRLGFDWKCDHLWHKEFADSDKMALMQASADDFNHDDWYVPHYSAPRLDQAQAWLRETKHIYVYPEINCFKKWFAKAVDMERNEDLIWDGSMFDTYEAALSAGITEALKLLEENN